MAFFNSISDVGPDSAADLVNQAWDYYRGLGNQWIEMSRTAIGDLTNITVEPISFSVDYNAGQWNPQFIRPTRPTSPTVAAVINTTPETPTLDPIAMRTLGDAPVEPDFASLTQYAPPAPPTAPLPTSPLGFMPVLDEIIVPDSPDYVLPELPTLYALDLPDTPAIVLPEFDGVRPTFDIEMPVDGTLEFVEVPHDTTLQDALRAQITFMMQGGTGLPLAVEQAIFDRGRAREDRLMRKQIEEISEEMSSRNLSEPNGIFSARLAAARLEAREKNSGLNRDLTIEVAKIGIENVKFAVTQGMTLEQTLIQQNLAINDRALRVAIFAREYAVTRINAQIAYANLQQQAYATDAQVWRQRIEGELAELEVYKAQIEGQRLVGEINKSLVDRYEAGVRAVGEIAQIYRSQVEAAKVRGEINVQRIDAARLILQRYSTEVEAWGQVQNGYRTQVEAALGTTRFAESLANVYATRVQAYRTRGDAYFQEGQFQLARNGQSLDLFRSELSRSEQDLRAQLASIDAVLRTFQAEAGMYEADGQIASAESASLDRSVNLRIESERNRTQTALQEASLRIDQAMKIGEIYVEQLKAKAAALAQLAAASQSGVNFGASMSDSFGYSYSKSGSVSWSGEAPDVSLTPAMAF